MQYPSSHNPQQSENLDHSDDESLKILDEWPDSDPHAEGINFFIWKYMDTWLSLWHYLYCALFPCRC